MPAAGLFLEPPPRGGFTPVAARFVGVRSVFAVFFCLLWPDPAAAWPEKSNLSSDTNGKTVSSASALAGDDAIDFYTEQVDPGIQRDCLICHKADGPAPSSGARIILTTVPAENHQGFLDFVRHDDVDRVLPVEGPVALARQLCSTSGGVDLGERGEGKVEAPASLGCRPAGVEDGADLVEAERGPGAPG